MIKAVTIEQEGIEIEYRVGETYRSSYGNVLATIVSLESRVSDYGCPCGVDAHYDEMIHGKINRTTVPVTWLTPLSPLEQLAKIEL